MIKKALLHKNSLILTSMVTMIAIASSPLLENPTSDFASAPMVVHTNEIVTPEELESDSAFIEKVSKELDSIKLNTDVITEVNLSPSTPAQGDSAAYSLADLRFQGVINWGGYRFTYYSQQVLPGGGLNIPGRHVNEAGFVADGDGFIVIANDAPKGTIIETPFGAKGKIYDRGTVGNHMDVYTS